jgi:tRNA threonylcarbamoyladenosine biosynthesis protein TsaB
VLLLALDTSTPAVTVALHDGATVVAERTSIDARRHGELLAPAVAGVLADAGADVRELTDVAVGVGPGPFTSLRIGLVTATTLGAARGIPVHGVCSLDILGAAMVAGGAQAGEFGVATDARRKEVYWARYAASGVRLSEPSVDRPAVVGPLLDGLPVAGEGPRLYPDAFPIRAVPSLPLAGDLAAIVVRGLAGGGSVPILPPRPLYLRRPDATEPGAPKAVLT